MPIFQTNSPMLTAKAQLEARLESKNIAVDMDSSLLATIGSTCCLEYEIDNQSRVKWLKQYDEAMKLVDLTLEEKNVPRPNCANIKYPLVAEAALQFAARALPNIIKGMDVVKGMVIGRDPDGKKKARAERIGQHMSWQITEQIKGWLSGMDKLMVRMSITGCEFKKTYQDNIGHHPESRYISGKNLVVNNKTESLEKAPRMTEEIYLYPHEVKEKIRSGFYIDQNYTSSQVDANDTLAQTLFCEQHRRWDLDDDGYPEPYIITFHKDTQKVARISCGYDADGIFIDSNGKVARIDQVQYYTKFGFWPSFDGSFYDVGFGTFLCAANESVNSIINLLLDAAKDEVTGGGIISSDVAIRQARQGGQVEFAFGEFKYTDGDSVEDLRKKIWARPTATPSPVLYNLLEFLISNYEKFASYTNVLSGGNQPANTPYATTRAMIQEGMKVFIAIFQRIFWALNEEYKKIYRLNRLYLDDEEEFRVLDEVRAVGRADYDEKDCDVIPVSDLNALTSTDKAMQAELLLGLQGKGLNDAVLMKRYLELVGVSDVDELLPDPKTPPQPTPEDRQAAVAEATLAMNQKESQARIDQIEANVAKLMAEANQLGAQKEMDAMKQQILDLEAHIYVLGGQPPARGENDDNTTGVQPGGVGGMESGTTDTGVPGGSQENALVGAGEVGQGSVPQQGIG